MICPECGAEMVLRTAKTGTFKGKKFWGCSNYPKCKCIVNIEKETPLNSVDKTLEKEKYGTKKTGNDSTHIVDTIDPAAMPYNGMDDMQFFQTLAVDKEIFAQLRNNTIEEESVLSSSVFRIDYSEAVEKIDFEQQAICALILRLLCRGKITKNSPAIEEYLNNTYPHYELSSEDYYYRFNASLLDNDFASDSEREKKIVESCLKPIFGSELSSFVLTQAYINSIIPMGKESNQLLASQRTDILICGTNNLIIEIDGPEHHKHRDKDDERDAVLIKHGYSVLRIENKEIDENIESVLKSIRKKIEYQQPNVDNNDNIRFILASKIVHQLQIAITSAILKGAFPAGADINCYLGSDVFTQSEVSQLASEAIEDLRLLFENYCKLYGISNFFNCSISSTGHYVVGIGCYGDAGQGRVIITDVALQKPIRNSIPPFDGIKIAKCEKNVLNYFLSYIFGFTEYREGQEESLNRLLMRKDSIVLLPTGSGKSLIYQLASFIVPGKIMIISPLTSLMQDQQDNLFYFGIDSAYAIYSGVDNSKIEQAIGEPRYNMIYISPERLQISSFRNSINKLLIINTVFAVAIDEAHCVSEWGHDFRTAYLNIGRTSRKIFCKNGETPVIIALTGTASTAVLKDVQRELNISNYDAIITPKTFDREELKFHVFKAVSSGKQKQLNTIIKEYIPQKFRQTETRFFKAAGDISNSGIIFCPHVNGEYGIVTVKNGLDVMATSDSYSGGAPKQFVGDWERTKRRISLKFKSNETSILVATKAFGMGIDKPNVRFTVHYGIPSSIESFYQEAGRAGRDRGEAWCLIILSDDNIKTNERLLDPKTPIEDVAKVIEEQDFADADDISRVLYFHTQAFKGENFELELVDTVLQKIFRDDQLLEKNTIYKCGGERDDNSLGNVQKAIQRLLVLGVIFDYTVDYSSREIRLVPGDCAKESILANYENYVRGYNAGRVKDERRKIYKAYEDIGPFETNSNVKIVKAATRILINFIYETIEKGRRRGLREMLRVAESAIKSSNQDEEIRFRIVRYFESTYSIEIAAILDSANIGFDIIPSIFDGEENEVGELTGGIRSANEASGLRGQVSRYLESTPDHPGLLALRALSELFCKDYNEEAVMEDYEAFIKFALDEYARESDEVLKFLEYFIHKAFERDEKIAEKLFYSATEYLDVNALCNYFIESSIFTEEQKTIPASIFFNTKAKQIILRAYTLKGE